MAEASSWALRMATLDDAATVARHRAEMFIEMHTLSAAVAGRMHEATERYVRTALTRGEYVGWLAHALGSPGTVVAGAGLQRRPMLPRPSHDGTEVLEGLEGLVLNVFVDAAWRRRGIAEALMRAILAWAPEQGIVRLVLHASDAGRPLYERMGFIPTNEMRWPG